MKTFLFILGMIIIPLFPPVQYVHEFGHMLTANDTGGEAEILNHNTTKLTGYITPRQIYAGYSFEIFILGIICIFCAASLKAFNMSIFIYGGCIGVWIRGFISYDLNKLPEQILKSVPNTIIFNWAFFGMFALLFIGFITLLFYLED